MKYLKLKFLFIFIAFSSIISVYSCKKDSNDPAANNLITQVTVSKNNVEGNTILSLEYNPDSTVKKITATGNNSFIREFIISSNMVVALTKQPNGTLLQFDTAFIDNSGKPLSLHSIDATGTFYNAYTYFYDGTGQLVKAAEYSTSFGADTITYTWANGDMVSQTSISGYWDMTYQYFPNKSYQKGDVVYITSLLSIGRELFPNSHLQQSAGITGETPNTATYEWDASGKITKLVWADDTDTTTYTYQY